jgi:hypothetical protein
MSLILDGTNGLSDVDGSASTPAIRGTDTNTGIFFPAADTIAFSEGGAEVARFDSSGNLGIGTASPSAKLQVAGNVTVNDGQQYCFGSNNHNGMAGSAASNVLQFFTNNAERMRITNGGDLLVGTTTRYTTGGWTPRVTIQPNNDGIAIPNIPAGGYTAFLTAPAGANTYFAGYFLGPSGNIGSINCSTTATSYVTSSDYRLKENIAPMTSALSKVALLKPCTYTWKEDGEASQGFIAHELQEVVPECVSGAKDAVDAEGNPEYQGVDTSFLVATLTAAIQEQQAIITDLKSRIEALEAK